MTMQSAPDFDPNDDNYAHCSVTSILPIDAADFFNWYVPQKLENFMVGSLIVPPVVRTEMFDGPDWGELNCGRHVFLKDKTTAKEGIVSTNFPESYSYVVWDYTSPVRLLSDYAKASTSVSNVDGRCRMQWDYAFHARNRVSLSVLKLFVKLDWQRYMQSSVKVISDHFETHGSMKDLADRWGAEKAA